LPAAVGGAASADAAEGAVARRRRGALKELSFVTAMCSANAVPMAARCFISKATAARVGAGCVARFG